MSSISVFGHGTPHEDWAATALTATAASGLARYIGDPDRSPLWLPYSAADIQGGIHGAIAAMLALRARKSTGEGQHAWVSIVEVMGTTLRGDSLPQYIYAGQLRGRNGAHNHSFYPWQVAAAKDGYIEVITMVDDQWSRFMELMGNPPWKDDERLENRWFSSEWADELDAFWHPWLAERGKAELSELFKANHIPFQPVHDVSEVAESEHLAGRVAAEAIDLDQIHAVLFREFRRDPVPHRTRGSEAGDQDHRRTPAAERGDRNMRQPFFRGHGLARGGLRAQQRKRRQHGDSEVQGARVGETDVFCG